jgi:hypothetical protein
MANDNPTLDRSRSSVVEEYPYGSYRSQALSDMDEEMDNSILSDRRYPSVVSEAPEGEMINEYECPMCHSKFDDLPECEEHVNRHMDEQEQQQQQ